MNTGVHKTYVECLICGYTAKNLTNHLRFHHHITAREYKEAFELNYSQPLECEEVTQARRKAIKENPHVLKNLLEDGMNTRYQKGDSCGNTRLNQQRLLYLKSKSKNNEGIQSK